MRIDISEVKALRECSRKWGFTSRNKFHLVSRNPSPNLNFGTMFHDGLARMYLLNHELSEEERKEKVTHIIDYCCGEVPEDLRATMKNMLSGYARNVLPSDQEKFKVLVAEYHFEIPFDTLMPTMMPDLKVCGSIDLIVVERETGVVYGFEHKTCKNFRSPLYNAMDEQPMLYAIALRKFVKKYNADHDTHYAAGGVMVNEVRKLKTRFEHKRLEPVNPDEQATERFLYGLLRSAKLIKGGSVGKELPQPQPGYMKCTMCDFQNVCGQYGYSIVTKDKVLQEFGDDFEEREFDHLDEKVERDTE